ncbi:hypothetical protein MXD63_20375 [Frankia sp. Cpl3]|nr:hypothetical protein [Frankia sp. Cpl3]
MPEQSSHRPFVTGTRGEGGTRGPGGTTTAGGNAGDPTAGGGGAAAPDAPPTTGVPRPAAGRESERISRPHPHPHPHPHPEPAREESAPQPAAAEPTQLPDAELDPIPVQVPGPALPPSPGAAPGAGPAASPRPRRRDAALLALSGGAAAIAAFLPWSTLTSGDETRTFNGLTVGDGRLTLVAGLVLLAAGLAGLRGSADGAARWPGGGVLAGGTAARLSAVLLIVLAGFDLAFGPPPLSSFRAISADVFELRPEVGVMVTLAAGVVALYAATRGGGRGGRAGHR